MSELRFPISHRVKELLEGGVITIGVNITLDGHEMWARCVQPHPRLGLTTSHSYDLNEIEDHLSKVIISPIRVGKGKRDLVEIPSRIPREDFAVPAFADRNSVLTAVKSRKLNFSMKGGVENKLPLDSLTPYDLNRTNDRDLLARAAFITDRLGTPKLISRIRAKESLQVKNALDLAEWWKLSTAQQKIQLLSRAKCFTSDGYGNITLERKWLTTIQKLPCPFGDAEAQVDKEEVEPSAEEDFSSADEGQLGLGNEGVSVKTW